MESKNVYQRMLAIQQDIKQIKAKGHNSHSNYDYLSQDQVMTEVGNLLVKHGVLFTLSIVSHLMEPFEVMRKSGAGVDYRSKMSFEYAYTNVDKPDEQVKGTWESEGVDQTDKNHTKAITFARREIHKAQFSLSSDYDPDQDTSDTAQRVAPRQSYSAQRPAQSASARPQNAQQSGDKLEDGVHTVTITKVDTFTSKAGAPYYRVFTSEGVAAANGNNFMGIEDYVQEQVQLKVFKGFINEVDGMSGANFVSKQQGSLPGAIDISDIPF